MTEKYAPIYYDNNRNDHFNKAKCYVQLNDFDFAFDELEKAVKTGFPFEEIQKDTLLTVFQKSKHWKILLKEKEDLMDSFCTEIDTVLRKKVLEMVERDQKYRLIFPQTDSIKMLLLEADATNRVEIKDIFRKYGFFPSFRDIIDGIGLYLEKM